MWASLRRCQRLWACMLLSAYRWLYSAWVRNDSSLKVLILVRYRYISCIVSRFHSFFSFTVSRDIQDTAELTKGVWLLPFLGRERVVWRCRQHKGSNHVPLSQVLWEMIESTFYSYMSEVTLHKKDKAPSETINNIQKNKTILWQGSLIQFWVQQDLTRPSEN